MKFSITNILIVLLLFGLGMAWYMERYRVAKLEVEISRLKTTVAPDFFVSAYHPNPDQSGFPNDPFAEADATTRDLYKALVMQPLAWNSGLSQYLGIDRIQDGFREDVTMSVWWHGKAMDAEGKLFLLYFADRKRSKTSIPSHLHNSFSAYIVTDANNRLVHWNGCGVNRSLATELEMEGETFPARLKYREQSWHNSDSSIEYRTLTKTGISD